MLSLWVLAVACKKTDVKKLVVDADQDGYAIKDGDCNDAEPAVHPGAPEVCDALDNDCDTAIDEGLTTRWWFDGDGDGYGNGEVPFTGCVPPAGYTSAGKDCDDARADAHPGAQELCNRRDDDCDGDIDEDAFVPVDTGGAAQLFADADGDGYGDPEVPADSCDEGVIDGTDCDDADAEVHPDHPDVCDDRDNDCDDDVDEDPDLVWFEDHDQDGWGGVLESAPSCSSPGPSYAIDGGDCDDADELVHPGATEVCDGIDQDCDGDPDAGAPGAGTWWEDLDGDTWGNPSVPLRACSRPPGSAWLPGDCDDADPDVNIDGTEVCNGVDDDCDGVVDDGAVDAIDVYTDGDGDGWGDGAPALGCAGPGAVTTPGDCDDSDAAVFPQSVYTDADGDGFGDDATLRGECGSPTGVTVGGDCDDTRNTVFPGASEVCDGRDDDCDTLVDEDLSTGTFWYVDADGDGAGDPATGLRYCGIPAGLVLEGTDCDDSDPARSPDATEVCNHEDDDCDGVVDWGLRVPIDQPTITDAIGAAADTDTICVSPGVYRERLDTVGKALSIVGTDGSGVTIVDGQGGGSVLTVDQAEEVVLSGLTLRNGFAAAGAGLRIVSSTVHADDVRVTANRCVDPGACQGTGIFVSSGVLTSASGLIVDLNTQESLNCEGAGIASYSSTLDLTLAQSGQNVQQGGSLAGAGLYASSTNATLSEVAIVDNEAVADASITFVYGVGWTHLVGTVVASDVRVERNDVSEASTINILSVNGIGASLSSVAGPISRLTVDANWVDTQANTAYVYGSALLYQCGLAVSDASISHNGADLGGAGATVQGGALRVGNDFGSTFTDMTVDGNAFQCPTCASYGAWGVGIWSDSWLVADRLAVRGNFADPHTGQGGGVFTSQATLENVIVAGNALGRSGALNSYTGLALYVQNNGGHLWQADVAYNVCRGGTCLDTVHADNDLDLNGVDLVGNGAPALGLGAGSAVAWSNDFGNVGLYSGVGSDGNLSVDPVYTDTYPFDAALWDLHPAAGSGLIDAGDPTAVDPDGSRADLGAYGGPGATW